MEHCLYFAYESSDPSSNLGGTLQVFFLVLRNIRESVFYGLITRAGLVRLVGLARFGKISALLLNATKINFVIILQPSHPG